MEKQLTTILQYLIEAIQLGKKEIPLLAQEIIKWQLVKNWMTLALALLLIIVGICVIRKGYKWIKEAEAEKEKHGYTDRHETLATIAIVAIAGSLILDVVMPAVLIGSIYELVQIYLAPRVYLLQYVRSLL